MDRQAPPQRGLVQLRLAVPVNQLRIQKFTFQPLRPPPPPTTSMEAGVS